jgi:hypothetical protein
MALLTVLALAVGCSQSTAPTDSAQPSASETADASAAVTDNRNCPIMGHAVSAAGDTTTWNDKTIGFCCDGCKPKFEALSDDEKAAKLAAADKDEHSDHAEHSDHGDAGPAETGASEETRS